MSRIEIRSTHSRHLVHIGPCEAFPGGRYYQGAYRKSRARGPLAQRAWVYAMQRAYMMAVARRKREGAWNDSR